MSKIPPGKITIVVVEPASTAVQKLVDGCVRVMVETGKEVVVTLERAFVSTTNIGRGISDELKRLSEQMVNCVNTHANAPHGPRKGGKKGKVKKW